MDSPDHLIQVSYYLNPFCKSGLVQNGQESMCVVYLHVTHATECFFQTPQSTMAQGP